MNAIKVSPSPDRTKIWVIGAKNASEAFEAAKAFFAENNPQNVSPKQCGIHDCMRGFFSQKDGDGFGYGECMYVVSPYFGVKVAGEVSGWVYHAQNKFKF